MTDPPPAADAAGAATPTPRRSRFDRAMGHPLVGGPVIAGIWCELLVVLPDGWLLPYLAGVLLLGGLLVAGRRQLPNVRATDAALHATTWPIFLALFVTFLTVCLLTGRRPPGDDGGDDDDPASPEADPGPGPSARDDVPTLAV